MAQRVLNLVVPNRPSGSIQEARRRSIQLYRDTLRILPMAVVQHELKFSIAETKELLRDVFRKNASLTNTRLIDIMVHKGYQDLEETIMLWNQRVHLERILKPDRELDLLQSDKTFLQKFFDGTA